MIKVHIPSDIEFCKYKNECKELYEKVQNKICDSNTFEFICQNTFFFLFENNGILIGAIYYFTDSDGKLFLNGYAKRKMHNLCIECLRMSLKWFSGQIYAEAQNRASALCLIKCGFKREKKNLFWYKSS